VALPVSLFSKKSRSRQRCPRVCLNKSASPRTQRENFFSKTGEREREKKKKRTLQHPRMAFTVFHHPPFRVPVRLERSHAVIVIGSVVHRAVSSSSSSLHIFLVFFFSVGQFDEPFHVSRRHRRVFKPLFFVFRRRIFPKGTKELAREARAQ
jgi:hypothetical protein